MVMQSQRESVLYLSKLVLCVAVCLLFPSVEGHGRLREPPSRSSMWRDGFPTPPNYNDNELNCGGFNNQWNRQGGKCGVCGDPWQGPRPNEAGGKYANGILTRRYKEGTTIDVKVEITATHKGWYEFRLCENKDPSVPITHDCLNKHLLEIEGHGTRYYLRSTLPTWSEMRVKLPSGVSCTNCVLQWKWHCGNNWGTDPDGTSCIGCGPQEQFYGCSDIAIEPRDGKIPPVTQEQTITEISNAPSLEVTTPEPQREVTTESLKVTTTLDIASTRAEPEVTESKVKTTTQEVTPNDVTTEPEVGTKPFCRARRWFQRSNGDAWCAANCIAGFCPSSHCVCGTATEPEDCKPVGAFAKVPGSDLWCASNCAMGFCPRSHCACAD